jgi:hypothetical protein
MASSTTGVFREQHEFEAALQEAGSVNLLVTGQGLFRARLTRIALHQIWGGTSAGADEIVTLGAGHRAHVRSVARSHWGTIVLPTRLLASNAELRSRREVVVPGGVSRWRPSVKSCRYLTRLHCRATRAANLQADVITTSEAASALEQELIDAVIACLSEAPLG